VKQAAAQKLARIMQIDPYTAKLQLPTRGWRLYRTGRVGELQFYASSLRGAEIPCFCASLANIKKINVFSVHYFSDSKAVARLGSSGSPSPQATVVCQDAQGQLGSFPFNWSEVTQRVEGLLPLFEEVVDRDARGKLQRKTKTLDYVQVCDLHLPARGSILRLSDRHYQFQKSITLAPQQRQDSLPQIPVWSDFTPFAETALDYKEMLGRLPSHIDISRRKESLWDPAFQLYSGLVFLKDAPK
jgi:hypothetical protein